MRTQLLWRFWLLGWVLVNFGYAAEFTNALPNTRLLTNRGDLSEQMVAGIDRFLQRELERSVAERSNYWKRDFSSPANYTRSVDTNRNRFRQIIGAVDTRVPMTATDVARLAKDAVEIATADQYTVYAVRWPVFEGVEGEGLLLKPKGTVKAAVIALPDADQTPEMLAGLSAGLPDDAQFARSLAELGCVVLVPVLVDRQDTWSGNAILNRFTNQPHREWIYRQAFEMGRHIIGYEVQKVLAAVDWLGLAYPGAKLGLAGYAEGGLIAFYAAALEPRIAATLVSGYFESRQRVAEEPIYRNVFGLLREFGDAEVATLIAPRKLIIEHSEAPAIAGPPTARNGRRGAAPGKWGTPAFHRVETEVNRAHKLTRGLRWEIELVHGNEGITVSPGSDYALTTLLSALNIQVDLANVPAQEAAKVTGSLPDVPTRQQRQVVALETFTQELLRKSEAVRNTAFWNSLKDTPLDQWQTATQPFRTNLWEEVIGHLPQPTMPANPRTRLLRETNAWQAYEVMLDVFPDVYAWGYLLIPKDLKPDERRPVVVCQHGLEGVPEDVINTDSKAAAYGYYKGYAARLAERGFVVYAPHNPYRGNDRFRVLQRKANPLKLSLFSVIIAQHDRTLEWLAGLPFVDPERIAFYGLSYGGKTAMRVPALLDRYCLSICSADFNEWIKKNVTTESGYSYMLTGEYEMPEFNLGHTFNYAEMAALIAPRPFMVERGHQDGVAPDEWVTYEYNKVRALYERLGISDRTEIELFDGPHTINGLGTFKFLHRHLKWPEPAESGQ